MSQTTKMTPIHSYTHKLLIIMSTYMCVCVLLATSPRCLSKLWCGDVTTSYIDHSGPSICSLLLDSLLIEPAPPSLPAVRFPSRGGIPLLPRRPIHKFVAVQYHPPTCASPVSIPAYQKSTRLPLTVHSHSTTPPPLHQPLHTCQIPVVADPFLPPKSLSTWPSDVVQLPPVATTYPRPHPPLPRSPSPLCIYRR